MTLVASAPRRQPRPFPAVFWVTVVAFGLLSMVLTLATPGTTFAGRSIEAAVAKALAGSALIGAGLYLSFGWRRPATGALFGLAACAMALEEWNSPATGIAAAFTIGLVGHTLTPAVVVHAVLGYPFGRLASRPERLTVAVAYIDTLLVLGLLPALVLAPGTHGCHLCPSNLVLIRDNAQLYDRLISLGNWLLVGWTTAFVALVAWRLTRASSPTRRLTAPVLAAGCAYAGTVLMTAAQRAAPGLAATSSATSWLLFTQTSALFSIGLAVGWSWLLRRRTRAQMAGLVVKIAGSPRPGGLQEVLGRTLGDPALRLAYALDGRDGLIDANGRAVDIAEGLAQTPLAREGRTSRDARPSPGPPRRSSRRR